MEWFRHVIEYIQDLLDIRRTVNSIMKLTNFKSTIYHRNINGWLLLSREESWGIEIVWECKFSKHYITTVQNYGAILEKMRDSLFHLCIIFAKIESW